MVRDATMLRFLTSRLPRTIYFLSTDFPARETNSPIPWTKYVMKELNQTER